MQKSGRDGEETLEETRTMPGGRIVVGVDASKESKAALRWAARYAASIGADLDVVHAWDALDEHAWLQSLPPPADPTDIARKALAHVVDEVVTPGSLRVQSSVLEGHAAQVLVNASKGADMLVVGSRGFGGFDGLLLGSVSGHCATHATCSVVIIRGTGSID